MLNIEIPRVQMKITLAGPVLLILSVAWVGGCSGNSVKSSWQQPGPPTAFSRILIVGISANFNQRCAFEFSLASQFQGSSTTPIVSCNSMTEKDPLRRANIERVVAATHAEAVLTSAVVAMQMSSKQGNNLDTRGTSYYKVSEYGWVTSDLGDYGIPVAFVDLDRSNPTTQITSSVHIVTKLFGVNDKKLLYTLDTETKSQDFESTSSSIETITGQIGGRLRRDGVIH
jgi:hypothetical protein